MRCDTKNFINPFCPALFQSTHLHEVRRGVVQAPQPCSTWFQSTHLHEVRPYNGYLSLTDNMGFNPRTYMRCDLASGFASHPPLLFQSTHLHEVRRGTASMNDELMMFQSTHLHEVRREVVKRDTEALSFNPRTYMRCDSHFAREHIEHLVSIHAPT